MSEEGDNGVVQVSTPFFSGKIAGKNLTIRDVVLTLVLVIVAAIGVLTWSHADGGDKANAALLREVKESNKAQVDAQRSIAYYQCRTACLLEQPQYKRDGSLCDRVCLPVKQ